MGILSSLAHPANGDIAGESRREEEEKRTNARWRWALRLWLASRNVPHDWRAGRWVHKGVRAMRTITPREDCRIHHRDTLRRRVMEDALVVGRAGQ